MVLRSIINLIGKVNRMFVNLIGSYSFTASSLYKIYINVRLCRLYYVENHVHLQNR